MKLRQPQQRGLTMTELLVALVLVSIVATAVMMLFRTSWLSYQNLVWQTKVNMEARRTLDDICDSLRQGGANADLTSPRFVRQQVNNFSTSSRIDFQPAPDGANAIRYLASQVNGQWYLRRRQADVFHKVGQHIQSVEFEYEYRLPAASETDTAWRSIRVSNPNLDVQYLVHTIYVTVNAEVSPFGNGGPTYRRSMTSAVHLRGPYNTRAPRTKYTLTQ